MHTITGFRRVRHRVTPLILVAVLGGLVLVGLGSLADAEPLGPDVITMPDTAGDVGQYTSIVLDANNNPVISYYDATNGDLKVLHCTNPDCSGTQTPQSPDTSGDVGLFTSLTLDANGYPVISYWDQTNDDLKVLHCTNPDCSGTQTPQSPDTTGLVGRHTSLALDTNGYPVISYQDAINGDLKVLHCTNPNCSGTQTPQSPDTTDFVGFDTSIAVDTKGNPVISYWDATNGDLKVLHCTNPNCSGTQTPQSPDTSGDVGRDTSLALDTNGYPVISYQDATNGDLKVLHCTNPNCSGTQTPTKPDTTGTVGQYPSLTLDANNNPVISYQDNTNGDLKVLHCTNPNCSGTQTPTSPDTAGNVGRYTSIALDTNNNPVISYYDSTNDDLKILHCYDVNGCGGQDQDLDGIAHSDDNCVAVANADQADADGDSVGDACDPEDGRIPNACAAFQGANVIIGTNAGETLTGTAGRDVILGLGGDDTLIGRGGDDCILGGPGADIIRGKSGNDTIRGQKGADIIRGGSGNDDIRGGSGRDIIRGQKGADTIRGQKGSDIIRGGPGADIIRGNSGNDTIFGNKGNDTINGGKGTDRCNGGPGTDTKTRCES